MALPTQAPYGRQHPISLTYIKISIFFKGLKNRYYYTVYLERQTTPKEAINTNIDEN